MFLDPNQKASLQKKWAPQLKKIVLIKIYIDEEPSSEIVKNFLMEIAEISEGRIKLEISSMNEDVRNRFNVEKGPIIILGKNKNIIYIGAPMGYELSSFLETIKKISRNEHSLNKLARGFRRTSKRLTIYTIVTPTCYYCAQSVLLANRVAIVSKGKIRSIVVNGADFTDFINKWRIMTVPTTVIVDEMEKDQFIRAGVMEERELVNKIMDLICEKIIC
ncbi:MAG: thioredoxin family protein [Candidatus Njordarchaeia archaeon]